MNYEKIILISKDVDTCENIFPQFMNLASFKCKTFDL